MKTFCLPTNQVSVYVECSIFSEKQPLITCLGRCQIGKVYQYRCLKNIVCSIFRVKYYDVCIKSNVTTGVKL